MHTYVYMWLIFALIIVSGNIENFSGSKCVSVSSTHPQETQEDCGKGWSLEEGSEPSKTEQNKYMNYNKNTARKCTQSRLCWPASLIKSAERLPLVLPPSLPCSDCYNGLLDVKLHGRSQRGGKPSTSCLQSWQRDKLSREQCARAGSVCVHVCVCVASTVGPAPHETWMGKTGFMTRADVKTH